MLLLVNGATVTVKRHLTSPHIGQLLNPRKMNTIIPDIMWAADNDAFNGFNEDIFVKMLAKISGVPNCLFVAAPDVIGNAKETLEQFYRWHGIIRFHKLPVALVGQDGMEELEMPWSKINAFFIGGSTEWKLGEAAFNLATESKRRGLWVHMGRVNSLKRIRYAHKMGCDSVDGSGYSRFPDQKIPSALNYIGELNRYEQREIIN